MKILAFTFQHIFCTICKIPELNKNNEIINYLSATHLKFTQYQKYIDEDKENIPQLQTKS